MIGEAADPEVQRLIRRIVAARSGIKQVNELITMHMGPEHILVNISVDFADSLSSKAVEEAVADLNHSIKQALPEVRRVFIEAETWAAHRDQQLDRPREDGQTPDSHG